MKVTTPAQMNALDEQQVQKVVTKFEEQFLKEEKGQSYYHLVIEGEYSRDVLDAVEEEYAAVGWNAKCRTSSEGGERPGLTGYYWVCFTCLQLSTKEFEK